MPILLAAIAVIAAVLFFVLRAHGTVKALQEVDRDTKGLQRKARSALESFVGTPFDRVRDVRLAAVILMIQIVRTGSPLTEAEKTRIADFMGDPLGIEDGAAMFERAWRYTEARRPFSLVADPLLPLLREALTEDERSDLVGMLSAVASAHSAPSELQREALARLKRRLLASPPRLAASRSDHLS